jgi:glycosyltransferase involved in cell wall biosynthesis
VKQRLLLVSRKWPPAVGGMETYSVELAESLSERFDLHPLVLAGNQDGSPPGLLRYAWFLAGAMAFCLWRGRRFGRVVFTDLILFPAALCHWLVAPHATRIVVVHGLDLVYQRRKGLLSRAYAVFFALFRACQGVCSAIVANSRNTAALATGAGLRRVVVINPSLPCNALMQARDGDAALPDAWPAGGQRILYFGRLVPRKGALWFARNVMPLLPPTCVFVVAGQATDPDYSRELEHSPGTACLGRVASAQLAAMIQAADVVVMPNIATPESADVEGFGLAAIEATALGGRLFASAIDGLTDAVVDGVTGRLLPPGDAAAWHGAIMTALDGSTPDVAATRTRAAEATRQHFSRQRQLEQFLCLLDKTR